MNKQSQHVLAVVVILLGLAAIWWFAVGNQGSPMPAPAPAGGNEPGSSAPVAKLGEHCGGNIQNAPVCGANLHCAPTPGSHLPFGDVGGTCVAN
jgi:hypothetical protein